MIDRLPACLVNGTLFVLVFALANVAAIAVATTAATATER